MRRLLLVVIAASVLPASSAAAAPAQGLSVGVHVVRPWFGASSAIAFDIDVANRKGPPANDLLATVSIYERARSRSQLKQAFGGRLARTPVEAFSYRIPDLAGGATQHVRIERGLDSLRGFQGAPDGVYPVVVTLRHSSGSPIKSVTTAAVLASDQTQTPFQVLPVLVVAPRPLLTPDGQPTRSTDSDLIQVRASLNGLPPSPPAFGLSVSPLLLDELRALRTTSRRPRAEAAEAALRDAAGKAELLSGPYSFVELPHLSELAGSAELHAQIAAARASIRRSLGADPGPLMLPPNAALDSRTLALLPSLGIRSAVVDATALAPQSKGLTPADPVLAQQVTLVPSDDDVSSAIRKASSDLDVDRVLADIAMIYFESPARTRAIAVVAPAGTERFGQLLGLMRDAPWLRMLAPSQVPSIQAKAARSVSFPQASKPPRAFVRNLASARRAVADLAAYTQEDNPVVASMQSSLQGAIGTGWWDDDWSRGSDYGKEIADAVSRQRRLISTAGTASVTFTSRRGEVPITVINRAGYPVRVRVEVESPKLRFPQGAARDLEPLNPPGQLVTFPALTDASGTFPLKVRITSPDGGVLVGETELVVRSTAYNVVALALTLGAAGFLVFWSVGRLLRRRQSGGSAPRLPPESQTLEAMQNR